MKKIAIIAAMSKEIAELKKLLSNAEEKTLDGIDFITGDLNGKEIILMESGIGKVCAAVKTTELINLFKPDCVINSGVAGGIGDMWLLVLKRYLTMFGVWSLTCLGRFRVFRLVLAVVGLCLKS